MKENLQIIHKIDYEDVFSGLNTDSIRYLRTYGLWIPMSEYTLTLNGNINESNCQIYIQPNKKGPLLTYIVENKEFLTGKVYDHIDNDSIKVSGFLHQYVMENEENIFEVVQSVHNNIVFLALMDSIGQFVLNWKEYDIEKHLKLLGRE